MGNSDNTPAVSIALLYQEYRFPYNAETHTSFICLIDRLLLIGRSGLVEDNDVEVFHHYGVHDL